jgi:RNA polymerase sigma-70 factor, ECF subfamily
MERIRDDELRELMLRYQQGDGDAVRELYARTAPLIRRYMTRWADWSKAQDLTQDAFLQIHRARRTFRAELPLLPWMLSIARHVALTHLRSAGRRIVEEQSDLELLNAVAPSTAADDVATRHDLEQTMKSLTSEQREIVWLADLQGFTSAEVARITGASEGAVRVRLHRARQKMKQAATGKRAS